MCLKRGAGQTNKTINVNITKLFVDHNYLNPRSPGGSLMVQKMAITYPIPAF